MQGIARGGKKGKTEEPLRREAKERGEELEEEGKEVCESESEKK